MNLLFSYMPLQGPGYVVTDTFAAPPDSLAEGSYNVLVQANGHRVFRGLKEIGPGARTLYRIFDGYAGLKDNGTTRGYGSVFNFIANSLFWIGEGKLTYNGTQLEDSTSEAEFVATSNLQLSPHPYEHAYTAGLAQPDAPIVEARTPTLADPTAGLMNGLYSFKIARIRSLTGGRSIASPTSAVILFTGQTARLTFPLEDSNGQDRWAVFATKAGFGGTGVHYLVQEIADSALVTIDGVPRSYEFNVVDADLLPVTAFIDDYPPPAGSFAGRMENYVAVVGAYSNAIAISIRNFPESFNPDHLAFLPKAPTAVLQDQMGSYMYISCEDSVHALSVAPSAYGNPMIMQTLWTDTGVANAHNWCSVEGVLYAFVSRQGCVAMGPDGKPTNEFAVPIAKKTRDWEVATTAVFHVPDLNGVLYCNGGEGYLWNYQTHTWSSPVRFNRFGDPASPDYVSSGSAPGFAISGVVQNRRLYICLKSGGAFTLYEFDEATESIASAFKLISPEMRVPQGRINVLGVRSIFHAPNAGDFETTLVTNYSTQTAHVHTAAEAGMQTTTKSRNYLPRCESVRVEFTGEQLDFDEEAFVSGIEVFGVAERSVALT
jgi:hypothetical protein